MAGIFLHFFYQRFQNRTYQELQTMIAELAPIEETVVGQELLKKGREEALAEVMRSMQKQGQSAEQIAKLTGVPLQKVRAVLAAN